MSPTVCFNTQPPEGGWPHTRNPPPPLRCFNTQPPEGGWLSQKRKDILDDLFQHTAARRRLAVTPTSAVPSEKFQHTAARRRLVDEKQIPAEFMRVSTHSRPKAAGKLTQQATADLLVSTHSRPKAAGSDRPSTHHAARRVSTHSRPKAAGLKTMCLYILNKVSTHSRPKAAGLAALTALVIKSCFNTQPPEGGWSYIFFFKY